MKQLLVLLAIALSTTSGFAQKKKAPVKYSKSASTSAIKVDNLTAEIKGKVFQLTIAGASRTSEAITVKELTPEVKPTDIKLSSLMATGTKLYLLQWTEKSTSKTDLKTEEVTTVFSILYEITAKRQVFSNTQKTTKITEKVFLDKNKTASETQEKIRREGFELTVNPDGTLTQKSKTQQNNWAYDPVKFEFVEAKKKK